MLVSAGAPVSQLTSRRSPTVQLEPVNKPSLCSGSERDVVRHGLILQEIRFGGVVDRSCRRIDESLWRYVPNRHYWAWRNIRCSSACGLSLQTPFSSCLCRVSPLESQCCQISRFHLFLNAFKFLNSKENLVYPIFRSINSIVIQNIRDVSPKFSSFISLNLTTLSKKNSHRRKRSHWFVSLMSSSYQVTDGGMWWQELAADLNSPKDVFCSAKEEKDPTVFSLRVS